MRNPADVLQATFRSFTSKLKAVEQVSNDFGLPRRQSMQVGDVAFDCEEYVVSLTETYPGAPGSRTAGYQLATGGLSLYSMDVIVVIVRAVPVGNGPGAIPATDALGRSACQTANDAAVLTQAFFDAMADNSIAGECDFVYFGGVTWIGPQGGLVGAQLNMSVQL